MHQFISLPLTRALFHSAVISFNLHNVVHERTPSQQKIKLDTVSHLFDLFQAIPCQAVLAVTSVRCHIMGVRSECQLMSALL